MEVKTPKVSVIMPCYNAEKYLDATMRSVQNQTLRDIEIIAVENGSKDGTRKLLEGFASNDSRISVVVLEKNQGVSGARNVALDHAKGIYVVFADSDDLVPPNAYLSMYNKAVENDCDVVLGSFEEERPDGSEWLCNITDSCRSDERAFFEAGGVIWNKLYKRNFLERHSIRFERKYNFGEDGLFNGIVYSYKPRITRTPHIVYRHLRQTGQLTRQYSVDAIKQYVEVAEIWLFDLKIDYEPNFLFEKFVDQIKYFYNFNTKIAIFNDRVRGFTYVQQFVGRGSWTEHANEFNELFHTDYASFMKMTYGDYLTYLVNCQRNTGDGRPNCDKALDDFNQGKVGFRYIFKYFKAWLQFKLKKGR